MSQYNEFCLSDKNPCKTIDAKILLYLQDRKNSRLQIEKILGLYRAYALHVGHEI